MPPCICCIWLRSILLSFRITNGHADMKLYFSFTLLRLNGIHVTLIDWWLAIINTFRLSFNSNCFHFCIAHLCIISMDIASCFHTGKVRLFVLFYYQYCLCNKYVPFVKYYQISVLYCWWYCVFWPKICVQMVYEQCALFYKLFKILYFFKSFGEFIEKNL